MCGFGKIILSRKGFDSSAGGDYSPFDPATGKYIVLPIPMSKEECRISNSLRFEEVKIKKGYFKECNASNLEELVKMVTTKRKAIITRYKKSVEESEYAHFDPWLGRCPWLAAESNHSIGAFGQVDKTQTHLSKLGIGEGSLFLFFSRFKPIDNTRENTIVPDINYKHLKAGIYFIYGWLRVREVIKSFEEIHNKLDEKEEKELRSRHPHATPKYFENCQGKNNTIYIAHKYLLDNSNEFEGCGYFPKLTKNLLLTATDSDQGPNWIPSRWKLPGFFYGHRPSCMDTPKRGWEKANGDSCYVTIPPRGQEFVFHESEEFCHWLDKLLREIHK